MGIAFFQFELRVLLFGLTLLAVVMLARPAWRAVHRDLSGRAAMDLGMFVIMLGQATFQSGYVLEGVGDTAHWRNVANVLILIIGCVIFIAGRIIKRRDDRWMKEAGEDGA